MSDSLGTKSIKLTHIDCEPRWNKEERIELFDMYLKDGTWIGSKRLLRFCERVDNEIKGIVQESLHQ